MKSILTVLAMVLLSDATHAQSPQPPTRQVNVGTWAELEERSWIESVRAAINGTSGKGVVAERKTGQQLALCVINRAAGDARTVVLEMLSQAAVRRRFPGLFNCRDAQDGRAAMVLEIPTPTLQFWLADALVRRDHLTSGPNDFDGISVSEPKSAPAGRASNASWNVLRKLGECITRRAPESVRLLAHTDVGTQAEREALTALAAPMGMCLPPGSTLRLQTSDVRGAALLSYYQLRHAAGLARAKTR